MCLDDLGRKGGALGEGVAPTALMKGVITALLLLPACCLPASASPTEVGASLVVVNGVHVEQTGVGARASVVPAPLLNVRQKAGRFEFAFESIPPQRAPLSGSLGLYSTQLSYFRPSVSYQVTRNTSIGVSELIYNQESLYSYTYPSQTDKTTDRSRIVGVDYVLRQTLRRTARSEASLTAMIAPNLRGKLGQFTSIYVAGNVATTFGWLSFPETGSQLDLVGNNDVHINKRTTLHFGVRYLNMVMRFRNGNLADRNAFVVPFFGWSTTLGR
jgi:hypothetical protein